MEILKNKKAATETPQAPAEMTDIVSKALPDDTQARQNGALPAMDNPPPPPPMSVVKTITKKFEEQPPIVLGLHPSVQSLLRQYDAENKQMQRKITENNFAAQQIVQLEINREGIAQGHYKSWTVDRDFITVEVPQPLVKLEDI